MRSSGLQAQADRATTPTNSTREQGQSPMKQQNLWKRLEQLARKVANCVPPGGNEKNYHAAMAAALASEGLAFQSHIPLDVATPMGAPIGTRIPDLIVGEGAQAIVVELKAKLWFDSANRAQLQGYLQLTGLTRGMLLGFSTQEKGRYQVEQVTPNSALQTSWGDNGERATEPQWNLMSRIMRQRLGSDDAIPRSITKRQAQELIQLLRNGDDQEVLGFLGGIGADVEEPIAPLPPLPQPQQATKEPPRRKEERRDRTGQDRAPKGRENGAAGVPAPAPLSQASSPTVEEMASARSLLLSLHEQGITLHRDGSEVVWDCRKGFPAFMLSGVMEQVRLHKPALLKILRLDRMEKVYPATSPSTPPQDPSEAEERLSGPALSSLPSSREPEIAEPTPASSTPQTSDFVPPGPPQVPPAPRVHANGAVSHDSPVTEVTEPPAPTSTRVRADVSVSLDLHIWLLQRRLEAGAKSISALVIPWLEDYCNHTPSADMAQHMTDHGDAPPRGKSERIHITRKDPQFWGLLEGIAGADSAEVGSLIRAALSVRKRHHLGQVHSQGGE